MVYEIYTHFCMVYEIYVVYSNINYPQEKSNSDLRMTGIMGKLARSLDRKSVV